MSLQPSEPFNILEEAHKIIYGDREKTYGAPDQNLQLIADFWNSYLARKDNGQTLLTSYDICHMMILLKIARLRKSPTHHDSLVDLCGYAALVERVEEYKKGSLAPQEINSPNEIPNHFYAGPPKKFDPRIDPIGRTTSNYPIV